MSAPAIFVNRSTTETPTDFGRTLRTARLRSRLSLGQLSTRCRISVGHLSQLESGRKPPTQLTLDKLTPALLPEDVRKLEFAFLRHRFLALRAELANVERQLREFK